MWVMAAALASSVRSMMRNIKSPGGMPGRVPRARTVDPGAADEPDASGSMASTLTSNKPTNRFLRIVNLLMNVDDRPCGLTGAHWLTDSLHRPLWLRTHPFLHRGYRRDTGNSSYSAGGSIRLPCACSCQ